MSQSIRLERSQPGLQMHIDITQIGHIGDGVADLRLRQRAARPVGEAGGFVEIDPGDSLDELDIGNLLAIAADHRRDLRVEQGLGNEAREAPDDLDVLPRGVKHLDHGLIGH